MPLEADIKFSVERAKASQFQNHLAFQFNLRRGFSFMPA
jgi:hypothetical protein